MPDSLLVINAGSSSLKISVYRDDAGEGLNEILDVHVAGVGNAPRFQATDARGAAIDATVLTGAERDHAGVLDRVLEWLDGRADVGTIRAAGHRVVHGGATYADAVRIDADVLATLDALTPLAPLHQPHNLAPVHALWARHPELPQIACFDTAFHRSQSELAQLFAIPRWLTAEGVKRYGFHGLSYEYIAQILPEVAGAAANGRVVVAHLGHGASMCAMHNRRSVATTMGFTALDGLPMGRRCGNLDPGAVLYLLQQKGWSAKDVETALYKQSGLYGVSEVSDDMAALLESDADTAEEAVALFCYRANRELGSLAAALGGLDALVFTAGIGEHAAEVRWRIAAQAAWLGIEIDDAANAAHATRISTEASRVGVYVVPTDEARVIAQHARRLIQSG